MNAVVSRSLTIHVNHGSTSGYPITFNISGDEKITMRQAMEAAADELGIEVTHATVNGEDRPKDAPMADGDELEVSKPQRDKG